MAVSEFGVRSRPPSVAVVVRDASSTPATPAIRWWWLLVVLAPAYLALAVVLPPADDELYYWCWSKSLQLSYYDHSPLIAWMIRVATGVFGDTLFAIRLPAVVSSLGVVAVLGWLCRPRALLPFVALTPPFTLGAVIATPDAPLMLFWALYMAWTVRAHERLTPDRAGEGESLPLRTWVVGGLLLGGGILGKYTMGLALAAGFVGFLLAANWRRWAAGFALHLTVAGVVTLPILAHNVRHDFAPLLYQWGHTMGSPRPGVAPIAAFVGTQVALVGTLPLWVFGWSLRHRRPLLADPRLRACGCLYVLPFAFFLLKATRGPLEANWALACYVGAWPLAAAWYETARTSRRWRWLTRAAFAPPLFAVAVMGAHLVRPFDALPPASDRLTRQGAKLDAAREVARTAAALAPGVRLYTPDYQWTALLKFAGADADQIEIDGIGRPSHFTRDVARPARLADRPRTLVLVGGIIAPQHTPGFDPPRVLAEIPLVVRGVEIERLLLVEYVRRGG